LYPYPGEKKEMRFDTNIQDTTPELALAVLHGDYPYLAVDIETVSLDNQMVLGIAVAISREVGFYFFNPRDKDLVSVLQGAKLLLFHNAAFDVTALRRLGYSIGDNWEDTMLLAYSAGILDKGLGDLSHNLLHKPYTKVTEQWRKPDQGNIAIDHYKMAGWSIQHAMNTLALWEVIPKTDLYRNIDRPAIELVIEMERWGLLIDQYTLTQVEQETMTKVLKIEAEIKQELGDINLGSNPQVFEALQAQGIIGTRKTKSGKQSVSDESLKPLNNPVANKILKYRSLMKTISTYVPAFRNQVDEHGRLHTHYGYTNTGRWNSSNPNLQNITRDERFQD
jgi:DNA polymerase I-like protein with 3'-5' exonuclease and polymerase domains